MEYNTDNFVSFHLFQMYSYLQSPWKLGNLKLDNRLIQGPLAGFSCAPFRELFYQYGPPAYCFTEMISAHDVLHKHNLQSRYLYRGTTEKKLCYQIAGHDATTLSNAAARLEAIGADIIDINCGCPKTKIRKKGAGSALLENLEQLEIIIAAVRKAISIPLTVKIRIKETEEDFILVKKIEAAGADGLIIHGRKWTSDYKQPNNLAQIQRLKQAVNIPVIANGDIGNHDSLSQAITSTSCDAFMIARAGTGKPWLYQRLLTGYMPKIDLKNLFLHHLQSLATLESEHKAILQSKSLIRYYFRQELNPKLLQQFYPLDNLIAIGNFLSKQL